MVRIGLVLSACVVVPAAAWPLRFALAGRTGDALLALTFTGFYALIALGVIWGVVLVVAFVRKAERRY